MKKENHQNKFMRECSSTENFLVFGESETPPAFVSRTGYSFLFESSSELMETLFIRDGESDSKLVFTERCAVGNSKEDIKDRAKNIRMQLYFTVFIPCFSFAAREPTEVGTKG